VPEGSGDVIVSGLPVVGDHPMHPFVITPSGDLLVDLGSATNACETQNRMPHSKGLTPCVEKETRGGIWRYDANRTGQVFSSKERFASGIRNGEGLSVDSEGRIFSTQHGRDQLHEDWPELYTAKRGFESPAEEIVQLKNGGDYGWPECYYDTTAKRLVLAPEYGGDGGRKVGLCAQRTAPVAVFPAHWAPNDLKFYRATKGDAAFPKAYRDGAFIAFHGSWNRAPGPQGGYNVVFQPFKGGKAAGKYVVFADGFAGAVKEPGRAAFRPSGLAIGPDGALFVSDDVHGRIWRVTYMGGNPNAPVAAARPVAAAGTSGPAVPPEGVHPDAGKSANLPVPPGSSPDQVARGSQIFHGQIAGATCGGCHGSDGGGSPVGADLTSGKYLWSDGSLAGIETTIRQGVPKPKEHGGAMPPMGGVKLSDADVRAVASYVWAIGHAKQ
jgi:glucose/arabinose dehydrogenase/cytochrome c5